METQYFKDYSPALGREMECKVYGHAGRPMLFIPCQDGRFFDFEDFHMAGTLAPWIESGQIMVISIDTIDQETWSDTNGDPYWRIRRYEQWIRYIVEEVVPKIQYIAKERNGWDGLPGVIAFGCSLGATHAVNLYLRFPYLFDGCLALSGIYTAHYGFGDYMDELVYQNSPVDYMRNFPTDHPYMELYRNQKAVICCGQGAWEQPDTTWYLKRIFEAKGIPVWVDLWILVYDCNVKDGSAADSYQVSNTVTLSNGSKSSDSGISYQVKADATATTAQFVLRKKDSYSGVSLKGAEFTISQYDTVSGQFVPWTGNGTGTLTTDENGQASLAVLDSEAANCLKPDVLYKLVETKAPTDYQLDATPHYLLFRKNASAENEQQAFAKATGVAEGTTILIVNDETVDLNRNVQVGSDAGTTTAEYSNVYSKLTVSKLWLDQDTKKPVEPAVDSIHIEVWRYTDNAEDETFFAEADLDAGNNWTATWSGTDLPPTDGKGNAYYYLVKETTTGNWNVYIDNNGVQTGNITIQNRVYTGYELPSTGGMGTAPFGVLGGALAAAAALLLARKRKQDEEE